MVTNQNLWFSHLKVGLDPYSILYLTNEEWIWVVSSWDYQSNVEHFGERIFKHTRFRFVPACNMFPGRLYQKFRLDLWKFQAVVKQKAGMEEMLLCFLGQVKKIS